MSLKIEYPKKLPELISKNIKLETGFYPTEVVALQNGWRLFKRGLIHHSAKISANFFSEHYLLIERFRDMETQKLNLSTLHQHIHQVMDIYGSLIGSDLNDVAFVNTLLSNVRTRHKLYGIECDDIKLITNYIKQYLINFLEKVKSTTFLNALNKLSERIIEHHKEEAENEHRISNE